MDKILILVLKLLKALDIDYRPKTTIDLFVFITKVGGLLATLYLLLKFKIVA